MQANPKLADLKDDDGRLPLHWAVSSNHLPVVELLVQRKNFDPDAQVRISLWLFFTLLYAVFCRKETLTFVIIDYRTTQDGQP